MPIVSAFSRLRQKGQKMLLYMWRLMTTVSASSTLGQNMSSRSARAADFFLNNQTKPNFFLDIFLILTVMFYSWLSRTFSSSITFGEVK